MNYLTAFVLVIAITAQAWTPLTGNRLTAGPTNDVQLIQALNALNFTGNSNAVAGVFVLNTNGNYVLLPGTNINGLNYLVWNVTNTAVGNGTNTPPANPVAYFTYTTNALRVNFTDASTSGAPITNRLWQFGTGDTSSVTNPIYVYANSGTYTVSLTVTDSRNYSNTYTTPIFVTNSPGGGGSTNYNFLAASAQYNDVSNAVALAQAAYVATGTNQVVLIPPGSAYWSNGITFYGIKVTGSGTNQTFIYDVVTNINQGGGGDYYSLVTMYAGQSGYNGVTALENIDFIGTGVPNLNYNKGRIAVHCLNPVWTNALATNAYAVISQCRFDSLNGVNVTFNDGACGLITRCMFYLTGGQATRVNGQVGGNNYQDFGDMWWYLPASYGSSNMLVIENCWFTNPTPDISGSWVTTLPVTDQYTGARSTFRYNTVYNTFWANHGTETTGRGRSARQFEIYSNTFIAFDNFIYPVNIRGGSGVMYGNTILGYCSYGNNQLAGVVYDRSIDSYVPWGAANGYNSWDYGNITNIVTFTNIGITGGQLAQAFGTSWTNNQFVGYVAYDITQQQGGNSAAYSVIYSNNANTIWFSTSKQEYGTSFVPTNGDLFQINFYQYAIDQEGLGSGDLIWQYTPTNTLTGTQSWPHEVQEPMYFWQNTFSNNTAGYVTNFSIISTPAMLIGGRDYTNIAKPGYTPLVYPHPLSTY